MNLFSGPGLAIRVLCAEEPFMCKDFPETAVLIKFIADYAEASKTVSFVLFDRFEQRFLIHGFLECRSCYGK